MAGKGGYMPGGGRPKGAINKKTQELLTKAKEEGIMPLDLLLKHMRFFQELSEQQIEKAKEETPGSNQAKAFRAALELMTTAKGYADSSAPYLHPKLSSIQAKVDVQKHEDMLAAFLEDDE